MSQSEKSNKMLHLGLDWAMLTERSVGAREGPRWSEPMKTTTDLTERDLAILRNAITRIPRGVLLPLPEGMKLPPAAKNSIVAKLVRLGMATEDRFGDGYLVTDAGRTAVGAEAPAPAQGSTDTAEAPAAGADTAAGGEAPGTARAKRMRKKATPPEKHTGEPAAPQRERKPAGAPKEGSHMAAMLQLITREEGATVDEIVAATGWQARTTRARIAVTVKRDLGYTVTTQKVERNGKKVTLYKAAKPTTKAA